MKRRTTWFVSFIGVFISLVAIGAYFFFSMIGKPMYTVGMVRDGNHPSSSLALPEQDSFNQEFWLVESGIKLHHFQDGNGKKVLVVHGGPGLPFGSAPEGMSLLNDQFEFVYYDQRGSGRSTRPFDTFSGSNFYDNMKTLEGKLGLGAQIADIERIRKILKEDKLTIIGHSFGAFIATLYAAEFPNHVENLVLVSPADLIEMPSPRGDIYTQIRELLPIEMRPSFEGYQKRLFDFGTMFEHSEQSLIDMNNEFFKFYQAAMESKGAQLPDMQRDSRSGGWMVMAMFMSIGQENDYRPHLATIEAPVLVIHGENDLQSATASMSYAESLPNAEFKVIAEAGHFSFVEQPRIFSVIVMEFYNNTSD